MPSLQPGTLDPGMDDPQVLPRLSDCFADDGTALIFLDSAGTEPSAANCNRWHPHQTVFGWESCQYWRWTCKVKIDTGPRSRLYAGWLMNW